MKKLFLITLLSVFFLSAFSLTAPKPEVVAKITFEKFIEDDEILDPQRGFWIFFYKYVNYYYFPDGTFHVECTGWGRHMCWGYFWQIFDLNIKGISQEMFEKACEDLREQSDEQISRGVSQGTTSNKIASVDPITNTTIYFIFQMNWDNDPQKPYNGKAEIIVTKTDKLAF
jgi:hypothetical protein